MTFLEILKNYWAEKNRIRELDVMRRKARDEQEMQFKKEERSRLEYERKNKDSYVVVAKISEGWNKSRHGVKYSEGKIFYTLMENKLGDRKVLKAASEKEYEDCFDESEEYKTKIKPWINGARNLDGILTYQQAEAQMIIDELKS